MASRISQAWAWIRRNAAGVGVEVLVNAVLPLLIYDLTDKALGDVRALLASSVPPIAWSIVEFVRRRRIDALSLLVIAGIVFSLLAFLGGGGARFLQLRENLVTGLIGLIFLISAAIRRPLIYYLARATMMRNSPGEAAEFDAMSGSPLFKRTMTVMTLVWGVGLIVRTVAACVLVFSVPIATYLAISPVVGYATMGALALWTAFYARRRRRIGAAIRAAREAEEARQAALAGAPIAEPGAAAS